MKQEKLVIRVNKSQLAQKYTLIFLGQMDFPYSTRVHLRCQKNRGHLANRSLADISRN